MANFYGIKIWDDTGVFYTSINVNHEVDQNIGEAQVQTTLLKEKPYVTYFGNTDYLSGTCTGLFADNTKGECEDDYDFDNTEYFQTVRNFLKNRKTKWLQLSETLIIRVQILTPIKFNCNPVINSPETTVTFNWVEVGKAIGSGT